MYFFILFININILYRFFIIAKLAKQFLAILATLTSLECIFSDSDI